MDCWVLVEVMSPFGLPLFRCYGFLAALLAGAFFAAIFLAGAFFTCVLRPLGISPAVMRTSGLGCGGIWNSSRKVGKMGSGNCGQIPIKNSFSRSRNRSC